MQGRAVCVRAIGRLMSCLALIWTPIHQITRSHAHRSRMDQHMLDLA